MMPPSITRLALAGALSIVLCHCDDGSTARIKSLRDEINQMNQQIFDASQQVKRLQSQINEAKEEKKALEAEKEQAEKERSDTEKKLEQLQRDFDTYKSNYKLSMQKRAPGMKIDDFTTSEGKNYRNVVLRELTDTYVNFTHESGIMKLSAGQLPESVQALLGFLNKRFEEPRDVKALSPRQTNLTRKAEHADQLEALVDLQKDLRTEKQNVQRRMGTISVQITQLTAAGKPGIAALKKELDLCELECKKLDARLMQAEVEYHGVRSRPPVLVQEKSR